MKQCLFLLYGCLLSGALFAQEQTQSIRGTIVDKESQLPLAGANVLVEKTIPLLGSSTEEDGTFEILDVPVGRHTLVVSYLGYQPLTLANQLVISGKQLVLEIELEESTIAMEEVVVRGREDEVTAMNEMALVSARAFSVEETARYAASFHDPARMARNYAGVSATGGDSDLFNEIIVRGNSPRGVLWRMEGIEIPNPNHFGSLGNTGGGISMLSSSTLSNSDFYTGAFPAEFGNASSGVFDLNLRKGNDQRREYAFMIGLLGIEAAAEGPFSTEGRGSYLVNVRYSTLSALSALGLNPAGDVLPAYGDLSFKLHIPTQGFGQFSVFGLGGFNDAYFEPERDSTVWFDSEDREGFVETQKTGVIGLSHKILLGANSYLQTVAAASTEEYDGDGYTLVPSEGYRRQQEYLDAFNDRTFRLSSTYHRKIDARNSYKLGAIATHRSFDFSSRYLDDDLGSLRTYLQQDGSSQQFQAFGQYRWRPSERLTLTGGVHYNYFGLTGDWTLEPRAAAKLELPGQNTISAAVGLHSKPEHPSFYFIEGADGAEPGDQPNAHLDFTKSFHAVLGYGHRFNTHLRIHAELYYQHLYDVPVERDPAEITSMLNVLSIWDLLGTGAAINSGRGRNLGLDLTIEKSFSHNYYFLVTTSLYDSQFRAINGSWYNTRFNSRYQCNFIGGREWKLGRSDDNILGFNLKAIVNGGERTTPIDLAQSRERGYTVYQSDRTLEALAGTYYRFDLGMSYTINRPKMTHSVRLDIQNVTNRLNIFDTYYSQASMNLAHEYHTGLFPVLSYRVEF
ncbi:MAG: TonB-dependent receptor [Saprospiraceae bacterium]|nr:TonB-dependent receptor [Saprospiraceae bacterium]